jgi:hypothetical protein
VLKERKKALWKDVKLEQRLVVMMVDLSVLPMAVPKGEQMVAGKAVQMAPGLDCLTAGRKVPQWVDKLV